MNYGPHQRAGSFFLPVSLLSSLLSHVPVVTTSTTFSTTTTSTVTVASIVSCIPLSDFSTLDGAVSTTTYTAACTASRRRRNVIDIINPSQPEGLVYNHNN